MIFLKKSKSIKKLHIMFHNLEILAEVIENLRLKKQSKKLSGALTLKKRRY